MDRVMDEKKIRNSDEFFDQITQIELDYLQYWREHILWHWEFWLSLSLTLFPWIVWFIFRKRGSEARLLLSGCFVIIVSSGLDFLGIIFGLWFYSGKAIPTIPTYLPWDLCLIPVSTMFCLQIKPNANPFFKAVIYSGFISFIGEPLVSWIGLYTSEKWNSFMSFPIYLIIYLISYRISKSKTYNKL